METHLWWDNPHHSRKGQRTGRSKAIQLVGQDGDNLISNEKGTATASQTTKTTDKKAVTK